MRNRSEESPRRRHSSGRRVIPSVAVLSVAALSVAGQGAALGSAPSSSQAVGHIDGRHVETVSPGAPAAISVSADSCPTFSWASPSGGDGSLPTGLALRVFEAQADRATPIEGRNVLEVFLPDGATSWTPPLERCLEPGGVYGWEIELVEGSTSARSRPRWFRISTEPSASEIERAVAILRSHLENLDRAADASPDATIAETTGRPDAPLENGRAAPPSGDERATRVSAGAGSTAGLRISGGLEVRSLRSSWANGSLGEMKVSGDLTAAAVDAAAVVLGTGSINFAQTLWAPQPGSLFVCDSVAIQFPTAQEPRESPCGLEVYDSQAPGGTVYVPVNGDLSTGLIFTDGLEVAADGNGGLAGAGIDVPQGSWTAGGGSGYDSVGADGSKVDYDDNESPCPAGTVAIGARLFHAGGDQVGIRVKCSSP